MPETIKFKARRPLWALEARRARVRRFKPSASTPFKAHSRPQAKHAMVEPRPCTSNALLAVWCRKDRTRILEQHRLVLCTFVKQIESQSSSSGSPGLWSLALLLALHDYTSDDEGIATMAAVAVAVAVATGSNVCWFWFAGGAEAEVDLAGRNSSGSRKRPADGFAYDFFANSFQHAVLGHPALSPRDLKRARALSP